MYSKRPNIFIVSIVEYNEGRAQDNHLPRQQRGNACVLVHLAMI